jgi:protein deglycase
MKYLMLFVDGVEDVEALTPLDVLLRGKEEVVKASLMGRKEIVTKCGNHLVLDHLIEDIKDFSSFDGLIIPGGPGSFKIMAFIDYVNDIIKYFASNNKLVAAICAAPMLVGRMGYYQNRNYVVHPGFEDKIIGGTYLRNKGVVADGNFISAKSMAYSFEFGLAIYSYFHGEEETNKLKLSCQGE